MTSHSVPAIFFVSLCLVFSGLVLRRQIAAHPRPPAVMPPAAGQNSGFSPGAFPPELQGLPVDKRTWHVENGPLRAAVLGSIQGQLDAFHAGDAEKVVEYQRYGHYWRFPPERFLAMVRERSPEFSDCRTARFGLVWTDADRQHGDVVVTVRGRNGRQAQGLYEMVRQRGRYCVAGFHGGGWMPK